MTSSRSAFDGALRAKHFYSLAVDNSASRHPLAAGVVVSHLQDAVEALAYTIAQHVSADIGGDPSFHKYWKAIGEPGKRLPYLGEMSELNHARVGFKHKGVPVSEQATEKYIRDAHRFLVEASEQFLGIDFDALSEADLIGDEEIRPLLTSATESLHRGEFDEVLKRCRDAVNLLDPQLLQLAPRYHGTSPPRVDERTGRLLEWADKRFASVERAVAMMTIGVQPTEYWLLSAMLPTKSIFGEKYEFLRSATAPPINAATSAESLRIAIRLALLVEAGSDRLQRRLQPFIPQRPETE